jgi:hypothetical protein
MKLAAIPNENKSLFTKNISAVPLPYEIISKANPRADNLVRSIFFNLKLNTSASTANKRTKTAVSGATQSLALAHYRQNSQN